MSAPPVVKRDGATNARAPGQGRPRRASSRVRKERRAGYLFLAPDVLGLALFVGLPMVLSIVLGFFNVTGFGAYHFVGFDNYQMLLNDSLFLHSLRITVTYVIFFVPLLFVTSLGLALLIREHFPGVGLCRSAFFAPHVVSLVVIGLTWQFMLIDRRGIVNVLLDALGIGGRSWLGDPNLALGVVVLVSVWFFMGFYMIIFLAGLQEIPREYYEAAQVDGASHWQAFRKLTWPLLKPTSFFVLLVSTINGVSGLQAFDLIYVMTQGGPANSTSLAIYYIYEQAFQFNNYGYASAMSSVLVLFLLIATMIMFAITRGGRFSYD